jgi:predicted transcriptional regulator of viral defense system
MSFRGKIKRYAEVPVTHQIVAEALVEYNRPNDKISELLKSGELQSVRRGLYIPGPEVDLPIPNPFLIANHLRGPSYVSLESALSYHGMIPERVYEISSATLKTSKMYTTPVGRFSYRHLAAPYYSFGIKSIILDSQQVALVASPEKAVCDKIVLTSGVLFRSIREVQVFLLEDMRMDEEMLSRLDVSLIRSWIEDAPKKNSLTMLVKMLELL